ncbi:MAG: 50S ribosomal protein L18 [Deltaproteobacteria bacterium]|nr:50S ribosomal protein L18 [Deltaproteobacteria bacterium]
MLSIKNLRKRNPKVAARMRRKVTIRKRVRGTTERPRLAVFKSARHIYAQVIDDTSGRTLVAASTLDKELRGKKMKKMEAAKAVGALVAERSKAKNLGAVVFDRNGFLYHGRVKSLADGAREKGLSF